MVLLQNMMILTEEQISALILWRKADGDTICMRMKLNESKSSMDKKTIQAAEAVLAKGYCVELRPVKGGIKVIQVIRQQITEELNKVPSP